MGLVLVVLDYILRILFWIIMIQVIASWLVAFNVINMRNDFVRQFLAALDRIMEPIYRPIRRVLPDFGGLDFAPLIVLLVIGLLQRMIAYQAMAMAVSG
jgi:YggT family protein